MTTPNRRFRRTKRSLGSLGSLGVAILIAAPAFAVAAAPSVRPSQATPAPGARLELVAQRFATDPNGDVALRYLLTGLDDDPLRLLPVTPPDAPPTPDEVLPEPPALTLEITNYPPLTDPDDVAQLVGSDVDPDAFRTISGDAVDGVAIDARPLITRNDDGSADIVVDIGTDIVDSVEARLKMEQPGLYPLRVQLLVGDRSERNVVATAGTVIQRLAGAVDSEIDVAPPIDLSVVTATPGPPPNADEQTLGFARDRLDQAIDLAAAVEAPVTLEVPPTLIAETSATPAGAERLAVSLADDELVALPIVPLDVSSAVAADRADAYTRLLGAGEDLLTETVPTTPSRRDVWITADELSAGGAQHLRDLGTRFVVIPAELYQETISADLPPSDLFVEAELPDGGTLAFLVVDPVSKQLTEPAADRILARSTPTEWSVETLAEMLLQQTANDATTTASTPTGGRAAAAPRRSRVLTTPDLASPDARLIQGLEQLAATTPSVRFTAASALTGVTDVLLDDGVPVTIQLPEVAGPSLDARIELLDRTGLQLASAASMLPDDDPRPPEWSTDLESLISTGYSDAEVVETTNELVAQADTFKSAVALPEPFTFTLTGRSGTIEVRIGNSLDEPLDVIVALDSSKVTFPEGDQQVTLRPLDETSVIVPVEAEANGTSSINLVVTTPAGEVLDEPITLTARVTALTGLGQVLTGGFVLVLLTWWFTHWRARRREELANDGRERHPSTRKVESETL